VQVQSHSRPEIAKGLGLKPEDAKGALVADVTPEQPPPAQAGLKQGDVITRFQRTRRSKDVHGPAAPRLPRRRSGRRSTFTVRLGRQGAAGSRRRITELKGQPKLLPRPALRASQARPKQSERGLGLELSPVTGDGSNQAKAAVGAVVGGRWSRRPGPAAGLVEPGRPHHPRSISNRW